jgi:hypothetical protein
VGDRGVVEVDPDAGLPERHPQEQVEEEARQADEDREPHGQDRHQEDR